VVQAAAKQFGLVGGAWILGDVNICTSLDSRRCKRRGLCFDGFYNFDRFSRSLSARQTKVSKGAREWTGERRCC